VPHATDGGEASYPPPMRRRSDGVVSADVIVSRIIRRADAHDPRRVVELLEPLVLEARRARLKSVIDHRVASVTVILDAPHDPHNGAAIVRSCEAFGVSTLHIVEAKEPFLVAASVARSAEKWVDVRCYRRAEAAIAVARAAKMELVAARTDGELLPADLASIPRLALVLGNERDGISEALVAAATRSVRVPMRGFVESLNVSVTAAVLLAAAIAGRPGDLDETERARLYARGLYFSVGRAEDVLRCGGETSGGGRG
jgi:tRNA (guanosine-2'-O-)-methyltransferase